MGCPYRTHINTHLGPTWVLYFLLARLLLYGSFYEAICFKSCLVIFCSCVFSIVITSLGEERANLSAFRMFVRLALVCFCLFPLPLGVWEGLRLVIVPLPGLFFISFFITRHAGYYGFTLDVRVSVLPSVVRPSVFRFRMIT